MDTELNDALQRLPHGRSFRFVDELTELEPGKRGVGEYRVRGDEPFLEGHFPGDPIFPGVLLVEAVAQLAGTIAQSDPTIPALAGLKLTAMRSVKITGTARPGECIELAAEVTGRMGGLIQAKGTARVNGATILQADVVLAGEVPGN